MSEVKILGAGLASSFGEFRVSLDSDAVAAAAIYDRGGGRDALSA